MKRPLALIRDVHAATDRHTEQLVREVTALGAAPPPCRAGCAWCCSEPVYAVRDEARLIAVVIRRMPPERQAEIRAAVRGWVERFATSALASEVAPDVVAYRRLRLPCPLLTADQRCSVYADRPSGCRLHLAASDPDACEDLARRGGQQFLRRQRPCVDLVMPLLERGAVETDHLALLLHRELFGEGPQSAAHFVADLADSPAGRNGGASGPPGGGIGPHPARAAGVAPARVAG